MKIILSPLARRLYSELTTEPMSKWELQEKLATYDDKHRVAIIPSERDVRRAIRELRELGFNIASSSDHKGYWIGDETARQRTIKEYRSRAAALLKVADKLEKGPDIGQMEMEI